MYRDVFGILKSLHSSHQYPITTYKAHCALYISELHEALVSKYKDAKYIKM